MTSNNFGLCYRLFKNGGFYENGTNYCKENKGISAKYYGWEYGLINLLSNTDLNNKQSILIYNILYGAYALLKRYETASRESLLIASVEEDNDNMRKYIETLHKNALHDEVIIPMIVAENIDI